MLCTKPWFPHGLRIYHKIIHEDHHQEQTVKQEEKKYSTYRYKGKMATALVKSGDAPFFSFVNCQRWDFSPVLWKSQFIREDIYTRIPSKAHQHSYSFLSRCGSGSSYSFLLSSFCYPNSNLLISVYVSGKSFDRIPVDDT